MTKARTTKKFLKFAGTPLAIFIIVLVVPFVNGFYYTFTDWNGFKTTKLVGFTNYADSFADPKFWVTLRFTALFVVVSHLSLPQSCAVKTFYEHSSSYQTSSVASSSVLSGNLSSIAHLSR